MRLYDLRCSLCNKEVERRFSYADADAQLCECGGKQDIFITQVNLSPDATPTRSWKFDHAPTPKRPDGSDINPGHEELTAASLRLTHEQAARAGL